MNLVMFDIDGTLTQTTSIDEKCFVQAVYDVLQIDEIDTDVLNYTHVTDQGIASEIIERYTDCTATSQTLGEISSHFFCLLSQEASTDPGLICPVPGAVDVVQRLHDLPDQAIAVATGGWKASALFKIQTAGFPLNRIPIATSSDAVERENIMLLSEKRAKTIYGVNAFESIVYVGDGIWDLRCAKSLGYQFIGVGIGDRASRLRHEGAAHVIADFTNPDRFFNILRMLQNHSDLKNNLEP